MVQNPFQGFEFFEVVPLINLNLVPMGKFFIPKKSVPQKNMYLTLFQVKINFLTFKVGYIFFCGTL